jgi:two-component system chemotaxis sensor kinase CheA
VLEDYDTREALDTFLAETRGRLAAIRPLRFLSGRERGGIDREELHRVFREIHSLKSGANLLGLRPIEELCHALEDLLAGYRDGGLVPGPESERELEPALQTIERLVANIRVIRALDVTGERLRLEQIAAARKRP